MHRRPRKDAAAGRTAVEWPAETTEAHLISDALAVRLSRHATCPNCGTRRAPGIRFCPTCGTDLDADRAGPTIRSWVGRRAVGGADRRDVGATTRERWADVDAGTAAEDGDAIPGPRGRYILGEGLLALTGGQMLALGLIVGLVAAAITAIVGQ
jgi:hypothetical protein